MGTSNKEIKIKPQRLIIILTLILAPIFSAQSAFAQTKTEYDALIAEAQAKVAAAQIKLTEAQSALVLAQQFQNETNEAVGKAQTAIETSNTTVLEKQNAIAVAKTAVDQAQFDYDTKLILDTPADVEPTIPGLKADIYTFNPNSPYPNRSTTEHVFCKTITVNKIDIDWGGGDIEGCGGDFVIIHYSGFITVPKTDTYEFLAQVDDGWYMTIGETVVNDNWVLKGCGGWWSEGIQLEAGKSYPIDAWFYEYGGGACNQLIYLDTQTWGVVPESWYSQNQQAPLVYIKDPALLVLLEQSQKVLDDATTEYEIAQRELSLWTQELTTLQQKQSEIIGIIESAQNLVTLTEQELYVSEQELEAIPPFREPAPAPEKTEEPVEEPTENEPEPLPEPVTPSTPEVSEPELPVDVSTVDPQSLSNEQVAALVSVANEILNNSEQGSPEYEEALDALFVAAQADDIVISEELAAIPGAEALVGAINFIGNVGADMSPKVREESEKIVVTAVVAVGAAVNAATGAALTAAAPSAPASASAGGSGGTSSIRRKD